jgi:hypothetical protein
MDGSIVPVLSGSRRCRLTGDRRQKPRQRPWPNRIAPSWHRACSTSAAIPCAVRSPAGATVCVAHRSCLLVAPASALNSTPGFPLERE